MVLNMNRKVNRSYRKKMAIALATTVPAIVRKTKKIQKLLCIGEASGFLTGTSASIDRERNTISVGKKNELKMVVKAPPRLKMSPTFVTVSETISGTMLERVIRKIF